MPGPAGQTSGQTSGQTQGAGSQIEVKVQTQTNHVSGSTVHGNVGGMGQ